MAGQQVNQLPTSNRQILYGYIVVLAAFFILVVMFGTYSSFGIFFKPLVAEFGWTRAMTSGAVSLFWIASGLAGIAIGGLNDRFGPRIVVTLCGLVSGFGYLLMSQISAVWQLYLFYGVIIGGGLSAFIPLLSTVAKWFVQRRTLMTGIVVTGGGVGALIMPLVASWLISVYDWRVSYMILGGIVLVVVVLAAQFLRRDPNEVGQVRYCQNKTPGEGLKLRTGGFSLREAVNTRQFWVLFATLFCIGFCLHAAMVHIAPHATDLGISTTSAANILATMGGASIVGRVALGSIGDRIRNRKALAIGFVLMSAALLWLVPGREVWALYLFAAAFGIAYGNCITQQSPLVAALFGLTSHGLIYAVVNLGYAVGSATGPFVAGYIFDATGSYQVAFLISAAISVIGLTLTMSLTQATARSTRKGLTRP